MSGEERGRTDSTGQKNQQNKNKINNTSSDGNKEGTEGGRIPVSSADRTSNQTRGVNDSEGIEIVQNQTENNPPGGEKTDNLPDSSNTGTGDRTENNPPGGEKTDNLPDSSNTGTGNRTENNPPGGEKTDNLPDSSNTGTGNRTENNPPGGEKTDNLPDSSNTGTGDRTENNPPGGEKTDNLPDSSNTGTGNRTENNPPGGEKTDNLPDSSNTGTGDQTGGALVSDSPGAGGISGENKLKEVSKSGTSEGIEQVKSHCNATQTLEKGSQATPEPNKTVPTDVRRSDTFGEKEESQQKKTEVLAAPLLKYQNYPTIRVIIMQFTISTVISIAVSVGISCWHTNKRIPPITEPDPKPPISPCPNLEELKGIYDNRVAGLEEKVKLYGENYTSLKDEQSLLENKVKLYEESYTSLKDEQSLLENKVKSYEEKITVIKEELGECEAMKSEVKQDIGEITSSVSTLKEDVQKGQSFMYNLKGRLDFADISNLNPEYIFIFLVILGFGEVVIGILIVHMLVKWSKSTWSNRYTTPGSLRSNGDDNTGREIRSNDSEPTPNTNGRLPSVLDKISSGNLKQNICVVGFNKGTMENHRKMVEEILQGEVGQKLLHKTAVVTKDEDILNIPRSKVMVVFVNGNGRHNILEGEFELGSLKVTTVRGIEKMGAKVILVYVGDSEAGKLQQDQLCIPKLGSSDKHEDLKRLMKNKCLYHVQKDLSEYQRTQLIEIVKTGLK